MRPERAKALFILLLSTLLRLQRAGTTTHYTQGAATLYPGLCSSALTARAGHCIFCEQVVRENQEQFYFGYIKLYTLQNSRSLNFYCQDPCLMQCICKLLNPSNPSNPSNISNPLNPSNPSNPSIMVSSIINHQ